MVPKFSRRPADWLPAIDSARGGRLGVEAHELRGGGRGREGAAGGGGVEAGLVVPRVDRLGDLALHLDAEMVGEHHGGAARAGRLADGERGRKRRRGRMREEAVDAVRRHRELGVVVVVRMDADAVGEGREARRDLAACCRSRWTGPAPRLRSARCRRTSSPLFATEPDSARPRPSRIDFLPRATTSGGKIAGRRAADELGDLPRQARCPAGRRVHPVLLPARRGAFAVSCWNCSCRLSTIYVGSLAALDPGCDSGDSLRGPLRMSMRLGPGVALQISRTESLTSLVRRELERMIEARRAEGRRPPQRERARR